MANKTFTHLHNHTEYSLLDGSSKIKLLMKRTKELGMNSIAITDHGVMYGVIYFYKEALKAGIKPILGCEVYITSGSRFDKSSIKRSNYSHLILLAENNTGYQNLMKLVSLGFTEGFYYKPRIDMEILAKYSEGLIGLSACMGGAVAKSILNDNYNEAKEIALTYSKILGANNFFLELQNHGLEKQVKVNDALIKLSAETGLELVCTNDAHYIEKEDAISHDILLCIQTGKKVEDEHRMRYEGGQFYLKSPEEMELLFGHIKGSMENTQKISDRCNVLLDFNIYKLPKFNPPNKMDSYTYLKKLCLKGIKEHYSIITNEINDRLEYELGVIKKMGFVDYFLIVWDFIKYAKDNNIMVGPGRGSAAGSIVSYSLKITDIDPLKYNLIFERFLNPDRISMPDIDIDFCYERRQEVINYVINKYGSDKVSQIITFGTMAARNSIRDVGRALNISYSLVDKIAKMIPMELKITIEKALIQSSELKFEYDNDPIIKNLLDMSIKLEGLPRHASTHAAGVVISDNPIVDYVPLNINDGVVTTQYTMTTLEELGLLKMDFLGLRTLTVIKNAFKEINRIHNIKINVNNIDYTDSKIYSLISTGYTDGIFQLESNGMKQFMKDLKPECIDDIIAGVSLYRPGPMEFIPKYIKGKNKKSEIQYTHPYLEPILNMTYGCIVYQEQVMQIVQKLAGYTLSRSDILRRVMGKKKVDEMVLERKNFIYGIDGEIDGCLKRGIPEDIANTIFDEMQDFAKYAFNKSHAAAYAVIACQTAWLKAYYPAIFMASLLTSVSDNSSKIAIYTKDIARLKIKILPPDINIGSNGFSVYNNEIIFSLSAIKNVGKNLVDEIVLERNANGNYKNLRDLLERMGSLLNTRSIESLIKSGAFDNFEYKRSQNMMMYKNMYNSIGASKKKNIQGQLNLFSITGINEDSIPKDYVPDIYEYTKSELLSMEKEILNMYVSGHPLDEYKDTLSRFISNTTIDFTPDENGVYHIKDNQKVYVGGIINSISVKFTRNNEQMAFLTLEDIFGTIEIIIFSKVYKKIQHILIENAIIIVKGIISISDDQAPKILANTILPYSEIENSDKTLWIKIPEDSSVIPDDIKKVLSKHSGNNPVMIYLEKTNEKLRLTPMHFVSSSNILIEKLCNLLGKECVVFK